MLRAKRGVCIGVERHLAAGDPLPTDLDPATVRYLTSIDALEDVAETPPEPTAELDTKLNVKPVKAGKEK